MTELKVGFALCGSFCTFDKALEAMSELVREGAEIIPIMSFNASRISTRFGDAQSIRSKVEGIAGRGVIDTIEGAEPIGPKKLCDVLVVAPCTGNTLAKLTCGIADTPVTMAVKSHLRNRRPVVIAVSTNDALAAAARNIGELLARKCYYFVPMEQDAPFDKPTSIVADFALVSNTVRLAADGIQMQPILK
ncbi:MAG: dipicolinate synthase subunit B [Oscillospiraceae bacterium]